MLIEKVTSGDGSHYGFSMWCPGCKDTHVIPTKRHERGWDWNGSETAPTFSPSLLVYGKRAEDDDQAAFFGVAVGDIIMPRCHSFIRDGRWEFLPDCEHDLAGQTVPMCAIERGEHIDGGENE